MSRLFVIHWKPQEIDAELARLRKHHDVTVESRQGGRWIRELRNTPPEAVVIDLSRLPSHGREVGNFLRTQKPTRHIPLIFVGGEPGKLDKVRSLLPDAHFCTWRTVRGTITRALKAKPKDPVVPGVFAGYSGTPLPKKLGIKPDSTLTLLGAPDDFTDTLGPLPDNVSMKATARGSTDVAVLFVTSRAVLTKRWPAAARAIGDTGRLWIAWPKKSSGIEIDLTQQDIREFGLDAGLVDFKICAIDDTWSGLAFTTRKNTTRKSPAGKR